MYNYAYQLTHDMDCYFVLNGAPVHVASNGGIVSPKIGTVAELQDMQTQVAQMEGEYKYSLNIPFLSSLDVEDFPSREDLLYLNDEDIPFEHLFNNEEYEIIPFHWKVYCHSFVEMARKGFWSFDRIGKWRYGIDDYMLVAWPSDQNVENKRLVGKRFEMESCKDWPRMPYLNGREWFHWPLMEIVERAEKIEAR